MLPVHVTPMFAYDVQLSVIEHLAKFLEFVLGFILLSRLLLSAHILECLEICSVLYETGNVDLCADEVA